MTTCRHCGAVLEHIFIDLGTAPPSNAYLTDKDLHHEELRFPLRVRVCDACWLVQTDDYIDSTNLFDATYAYLSSTSRYWLNHAKRFSKRIIRELSLNSSSYVIEIASNDGYLLKNFSDEGIPCLGVEPTDSTASVAEQLGIPVIRQFFDESVAAELETQGKKADLVVGNNVLAHVPDINGFCRGLKKILKSSGTITLEFPHLQRLITELQFDTIYHEHFSYLSLNAVKLVLDSVGLRIWNVEELRTHGGSLRVFGCHQMDPRPTNPAVALLLQAEEDFGLQKLETYQHFQSHADRISGELLSFLTRQKSDGKLVVAYGAAAKGNTLLNYAKVTPDLLPAVFDAARSKQGRYMPGSRIPIYPAELLMEWRPDFVLILPWNIADEVITQYAALREDGVQFVTAIPRIRIF